SESRRATGERVRELDESLARAIAEYSDDAALDAARLTATREHGEKQAVFEALAATVARLDAADVEADALRTERALRTAHDEVAEQSRELHRLGGRLGAGDLIGFHERRGRAEATVLSAQQAFDAID